MIVCLSETEFSALTRITDAVECGDDMGAVLNSLAWLVGNVAGAEASVLALKAMVAPKEAP